MVPNISIIQYLVFLLAVCLSMDINNVHKYLKPKVYR